MSCDRTAFERGIHGAPAEALRQALEALAGLSFWIAWTADPDLRRRNLSRRGLRAGDARGMSRRQLGEAHACDPGRDPGRFHSAMNQLRAVAQHRRRDRGGDAAGEQRASRQDPELAHPRYPAARCRAVMVTCMRVSRCLNQAVPSSSWNYLVACVASTAAIVHALVSGSQSPRRCLLSGLGRRLDNPAPGPLSPRGAIAKAPIRHKCERLRRPATDIGSLARGNPCTASRRVAPTTALRTTAGGGHPARYPAAYGAGYLTAQGSGYQQPTRVSGPRASGVHGLGECLPVSLAL